MVPDSPDIFGYHFAFLHFIFAVLLLLLLLFTRGNSFILLTLLYLEVKQNERSAAQS
jgi:hypothetical protein